MKQLFARLIAPALCVMVLMSACAGGKREIAHVDPAEQLSQPFESTVSIRYKELDATAKIAKQAPGYCKVTFTSPKALQDMSVEFTTDQVNISYQQLHASFDPASISGSAVSKMLVAAIDSAAKENGVRVEYQNSVLLVTGEMESGTFTLSLDPENGNLIKLSVPEDDFEAEFSNFNFIAR